MTKAIKASLIGSFAALLLGVSMSASAAFTNWDEFLTLDGSTDGLCERLLTAGGTCNAPAASLTTLQIIGTNVVGNDGGGTVRYTSFAGSVLTLAGTWSYSTVDKDTSPVDDFAGYFLNDVYTPFTTGVEDQTATFSFDLKKDDLFGFYVTSLSGTGGAGTLTVTSSDTGGTVPEPGSLVLVGLGLLGVAAIRRRKQ